MMEFKTVRASRGLAWYAGAWALFKGQFGMWLLLFMLYLGIAIALELIPMLGPVIFALLSPALTGGLYLAAREAEAGRPLEAGLLFQPLKDERTRGPLLTLGGISIVFSLVLTMVLLSLLGGAAMLSQTPEELESQLKGLGLSGLVTLLLISLVFMLAMLYAVPHVLFSAIPPMQALKHSLLACLANWLPLTVFGLVFIPLALLASLPLMLGWVLLLPVVMIAVYVSYREIFGEPLAPPEHQDTTAF